METTEIFFFDGEVVRSETVPVQQLPALSSTRSFWRGNAFSMEEREKMMRQRLATTFLRGVPTLNTPSNP